MIWIKGLKLASLLLKKTEGEKSHIGHGIRL